MCLDTVMIGDDVRDDVLGAQAAGFKVQQFKLLNFFFNTVNVRKLNVRNHESVEI